MSFEIVLEIALEIAFEIALEIAFDFTFEIAYACCRWGAAWVTTTALKLLNCST